MQDLKFSKTHEWAKIEGDTATVGITDYAQKFLGDVVFVELPNVATSVKQFAQFGTIESTKAASELYAPLGGEVLEINKPLVNNPQWVNEDAFGRGWMIKIKLSDLKEIANLMDEVAYNELIAKESH